MYTYTYRSLATDHSRHTEHSHENQEHQCPHSSSPPALTKQNGVLMVQKCLCMQKVGASSSRAQPFILPSSCSSVPVSPVAGFWYTSPQGLSPSHSSVLYRPPHSCTHMLWSHSQLTCALDPGDRNTSSPRGVHLWPTYPTLLALKKLYPLTGWFSLSLLLFTHSLKHLLWLPYTNRLKNTLWKKNWWRVGSKERWQTKMIRQRAGHGKTNVFINKIFTWKSFYFLHLFLHTAKFHPFSSSGSSLC